MDGAAHATPSSAKAAAQPVEELAALAVPALAPPPPGWRLARAGTHGAPTNVDPTYPAHEDNTHHVPPQTDAQRRGAVWDRRRPAGRRRNPSCKDCPGLPWSGP